MGDRFSVDYFIEILILIWSNTHVGQMVYQMDICSLLGPMGFIPRKCPWEKRTPWSPCPKTAFNNLTCNPTPPPPPGHPRGFAIFFLSWRSIPHSWGHRKRQKLRKLAPARVSLACLLDFISRLHVCVTRSSLLARPISNRNAETSSRVYMKLLRSFVQEWNSRHGTTTRVNSSRRNSSRHPILWWCKQIQSHESEPEWTLAGPIVVPEHVNTPYQNHVLMLINHTLTRIWSASKVP